jgi:hypothetical protein
MFIIDVKYLHTLQKTEQVGHFAVKILEPCDVLVYLTYMDKGDVHQQLVISKDVTLNLLASWRYGSLLLLLS